MTDLATQLALAKPREKAGARTGARFVFQAHVALTKILDLHVAGSKYCAVFDYYDDLTLLDDARSPQEVAFFQIKGKDSGNWTTASLCVPEGKSPQTIVGKMYHHTTTFKASTKECTFVTNAPFSFDMASGGKSSPDHMSIVLGDLDVAELKKIATALDLDFPTTRSPHEGSVLKFERTLVPTKKYDLFLKGQLVEILTSATAAAIGALHRTLIADIVSKANETRDLANFADIVRYKALDHTEVAEVLAAAASRSNVLDVWDILNDELKVMGRTPVERIHARAALIAFARARSIREARVELLVQNLAAVSQSLVASIKAAPDMLSAAALIRAQLAPAVVQLHGADELEAACLTYAYEALHE